MRVKKRDGRIVDFNPENIKRTIQYAAQAVEVRDLDFQTHAEEFNDLVKQLMKSGVQLEEARDLAEDQISGYILDGVYTEFDGDEADEVVDFVVESLDSSGKDIVDVELIQDVIENALISTGHKKTAKEYITRRAQRDRARDMNSRLMKSFEGITFKNSIDNDTKRENANIDGDSAMGTMLKYGSESAKEFNLLYLVSPDIADAHRSGDIHIHDLDFAALTETCVSGDTMLSIKNTETGGELTVSAAYFDKFLDKYPVDTVVTLDNFKIMSGDRYVNLVNCVRHSSDGKRVLQIETEYGKICVTSEHKIPVVRNGKVMVLKAEEIVAGDELQVGADIPMVRAKDTQKVVDIRDIEYSGYVYDFETEDHYFNANGFRVHNCVQIDLLKLFKGGFNTGHGFLREPQDIRTAGALACIAIQSSQNDMHGGQSVPAFDYYLAEYVQKSYIKNLISVLEDRFDDIDVEDIKEQIKAYAEQVRPKDVKNRALIMNPEGDKTVKEIILKYSNILLKPEDIDKVIKRAYVRTTTDTHQQMEAVVHNLNSMHSRAGAQVPFSSLNFGTDTSYEGRLVIEQLLLSTDEGLGNGETPIFPVSVYKMKKGVSAKPGDPNYDLFQLACKVSAKRLFPNFGNVSASYNIPKWEGANIDSPDDEYATMGCRTRVFTNVRNNGINGSVGRGNLSFTSINLPRLGLLAGHGNIDKFFELLDERMELVHRQLKERFEIQCLRHPRNYPFLMGQGIWKGSEDLGPDDDIRDALQNGTLTVGFIGLAETLVALTGKHHGESEESQELGLKIIGHMRELTDKWTQEEKMNYSVIGTPAEGLSGRFVKIDAKRFGKIPGITDREYYTNSSHVPVYYPISAFKKIQIEAPYHALENGGHICYIEMDGDPAKNVKAFEKVVQYAYDHDIGYFAVNHPVDRDSVCGYVGIIGDVCPRCGRRDGEPMTEEMWEKLHNKYAYTPNASSCGYCGDPNEERDRQKNLNTLDNE